MALSDEERAFLRAQLDHDELLTKDKRSKADEERLVQLETDLFEARSSHRASVQAQMQAMDGAGGQPKKGDN